MKQRELNEHPIEKKFLELRRKGRMLDDKDICDVINLCDAFRMKAKELLDARLAEKKDVRHGGRITSAAEHAALLRCSLDLTRALAHMRRRK